MQAEKPKLESVWLVVQDDPRAVTLDVDGVPRIMGHGRHNLTWMLAQIRSENADAVAKARAEMEIEIAKLANLQASSGSADSYGQGLYNGLMLALNLIAKDPPCVDRTVTLDEFKAMNNSPPPAGASTEQGRE